MKSLTPEQTANKLGWKEALQSLRKAKTFGAPKPEHYHRYHGWGYYRWQWTKVFVRWCIEWCKWPWRSFLFYRNLYKQSKVPFVAEYKKLAEQGTPSHEAFKKCKVKMHLTEDEIFEQGNRILRGEYKKELDNGDLGLPFHTSETNIPTGRGKFPTKLSRLQQKKLR